MGDRGDPISPKLFTAVIEELLKNRSRQGNKHRRRKITKPNICRLRSPGYENNKGNGGTPEQTEHRKQKMRTENTQR